MKEKFGLIFVFFLLLVSSANAWEPHLTGDSFAPETLLVVSKGKQNFFVFSNKSPLKKEYSWQCTTGQAHGSKLIEGDLKTPEGIYFLERRISQNLPFDLYGELAFTLNYPNPIDRIHNRTGHSIWIHGRGREVVPFDTEGCVAMDMEHMRALEDIVVLAKTPVVITDDMTWDPVEAESQNSSKVAYLSKAWARDWKMRSESYFEHYNQTLFTKSSGISFNNFKAHKKRLFDQYSWLDVFIEEPKVLEGPEYWVSYFGQVYKAPGFYSTGIKRLYWKQDDDGEFRIVGEEWRSYPHDYLEQDYLLSRKEEIRSVISGWQKAWLEADIKKYGSFYHKDAVQGDLKGIDSILDHKRDIWGRGALPADIDLEKINIALTDQNFRVNFLQNYASVAGYSDYGRKTLVMAPYGDEWLITSESWSEIR